MLILVDSAENMMSLTTLAEVNDLLSSTGHTDTLVWNQFNVIQTQAFEIHTAIVSVILYVALKYGFKISFII